MPGQNITDAFVRNAKPPRKDDKRQDVYIDTLERGLALVLVVSYGGTKSFRVLTYRNGKPHSVKLPGGTYPMMTVKQARAKAREYWADPQRFEAQAEVGTFGEIAENWIKRHVTANKLRSQREIERMLKKYVYPEWKDRKFLEIRRRESTSYLMTSPTNTHPRPTVCWPLSAESWLGIRAGTKTTQRRLCAA